MSTKRRKETNSLNKLPGKEFVSVVSNSKKASVENDNYTLTSNSLNIPPGKEFVSVVSNSKKQVLRMIVIH